MSTDTDTDTDMTIDETAAAGKGRGGKPRKRQFHHRQRAAAERRAASEAEHALAAGIGTIFVAAAARVLRTEYGWEQAATVAFGERVAVVAGQMAAELAAKGRERGGTASWNR